MHACIEYREGEGKDGELTHILIIGNHRHQLHGLHFLRLIDECVWKYGDFWIVLVVGVVCVGVDG
jgi:hypothetical protein